MVLNDNMKGKFDCINLNEFMISNGWECYSFNLKSSNYNFGSQY